MKTYQLVGKIKTIEPVTVTISGVSGKQHQMPKMGQLAYIPASSIRGALRTCGIEILNDILKSKNNGEKVFRLNDLLMLAQGYFTNADDQKQATKKGTSTPIDFGESVRQENPFLSNFGRWGLSSKVGVGSAYCTSVEQCQRIAGGFRGVLFERTPKLFDDLEESEQNSFFDLIDSQMNSSGLKADLTKQQKALYKAKEKETESAAIKELDKELKAVNAQLDQLKENKESEVLRRPIDDVEAIIANTELPHRISLNSCTNDELAMLLLCLAKFSTYPRLGGKVNHNFGLVHLEYDVLEFNSTSKDSPWRDFGSKKIGTVKVNDSGFEVTGDIENVIETFVENISGYDFSKAY